MFKMFLHLLYNFLNKTFITKIIKIWNKGSLILTKQYSVTLKTGKTPFFRVSVVCVEDLTSVVCLVDQSSDVCLVDIFRVGCGLVLIVVFFCRMIYSCKEISIAETAYREETFEIR